MIIMVMHGVTTRQISMNNLVAMDPQKNLGGKATKGSLVAQATKGSLVALEGNMVVQGRIVLEEGQDILDSKAAGIQEVQVQGLVHY